MLGRASTVVLIVLLSLLGPLTTDMYLPGMPEMVAYFGTSESVLSMTLYVYMLVQAVGVLFMGPLSDKYGRRKVLLASMAVYIVASAGCCFAPNIWALVAFRALEALGAAGGMCLSVALIKDCFSGREMTFVLSLSSALIVLGPILAPIVGSFVIGAFDWTATFWVLTIVSLVCLAMTLGVPSDLPKERSEGTLADSLREIRTVTRNRDFTAFTILATVFMFAQLAFISVSTYIYQDGFGLSSTAYSLALAGTMVGGIVVMAALQGRLTRCRTAVTLGALLGLAVVSLVAMAAFGSTSWAALMVSLMPFAGSVMIARSYGFNVLMSQPGYPGGAVSSLVNFSTFAFSTIGIALASQSWDSYIDGLTVILLASCVIYAVMWVYIARRGYRLQGLTGGPAEGAA